MNSKRKPPPAETGLETLQLPSGGTWTLVVRPKGKHLAHFVRLEQLGEEEPDTGLDIPFARLAALTMDWSFPEEISAEGVAERDMEDLIQVFEVVNNRILPLLERLQTMNAGTSPSSSSGNNRSRRNGHK